MADFIRVKEGITGSIAHEIMEYDGSIDIYISDQIARIDGFNPHLMKELCSFAVAGTHKLLSDDLEVRMRARMVCAGILVYRMLESQFEADELDSLLGD